MISCEQEVERWRRGFVPSAPRPMLPAIPARFLAVRLGRADFFYVLGRGLVVRRRGSRCHDEHRSPPRP